MKIAHASDLHGKWDSLTSVVEPPDLWVFTGDMLPNKTRGHVHIEVPFQTRWYGQNASTLIAPLRGVPVLLVPGNHDYADLAKLLRRDGVNAHEVSPRGRVVQGHRFAGFGHIPIIGGEWNREATSWELTDLTEATLNSDPDVLLTHAPPCGILNGDYAGVSALTNALTYRPHRVKLHLFGHAHEGGLKQVTHMGVRFVNSATGVQVLDFP